MAVNAELFSRDKQNVPMLLSLLEEPPTGVDDFHCRYQALQILTGLSSSLHRLQEVRLRNVQISRIPCGSSFRLHEDVHRSSTHGLRVWHCKSGVDWSADTVQIALC